MERDAFTYDAPAAMLFHVGPTGDSADCAIVTSLRPPISRPDD